MTVKIRSEPPDDADSIAAVTRLAFHTAPHASGTEQYIVNALRRAGALTVSLIAEDDGNVVGHVAISPVTISDGSAQWFGLGPVSVLPERQGAGLGSRLVREALSTLRALRAAGCVVLGEPAYYSRFGFRQEPALILPGVPPEYFMAIAFRGSMPAGTVAYHASFEVRA
jgi:predicted N-acetyltransferase YhbS